MRRLLLALLFPLAGCQTINAIDQWGKDIDQSVAQATGGRETVADAPATPAYSSDGLKLNAYGPGIHQNQYGQSVILRPDFGGVPGERLEIKPNAYGPGVHMDQYGRPVREYPW